MAESAADFIPENPTMPRLRKAAAGCRGCDLYERGTQTVFGEGAGGALLMLVGEQPGDQEDLQGRPFVGPAGKLLDRALADAGIDRSGTYVTNAVKHFKWVPRGKRRIHSKPSSYEIRACAPWLGAEIAAVSPTLVVCLGATAAQALLGTGFRVTKSRGQVLKAEGGYPVLATLHPSAILRGPSDARERAYGDLVADLRHARETAEAGGVGEAARRGPAGGAG